eukprot:Lithocolla_globosa_v1_NODE_3549_length_1640_cov_113.752681.p3 type:complete len:158 gc:universal NODE_3549_length_1640_cov_113.752681:1158-685(-)
MTTQQTRRSGSSWPSLLGVETSATRVLDLILLQARAILFPSPALSLLVIIVFFVGNGTVSNKLVTLNSTSNALTSASVVLLLQPSQLVTLLLSLASNICHLTSMTTERLMMANLVKSIWWDLLLLPLLQEEVVMMMMTKLVALATVIPASALPLGSA